MIIHTEEREDMGTKEIDNIIRMHVMIDTAFLPQELNIINAAHILPCKQLEWHIWGPYIQLKQLDTDALIVHLSLGTFWSNSEKVLHQVTGESAMLYSESLEKMISQDMLQEWLLPRLE
jgi:hypothetical protein